MGLILVLMAIAVLGATAVVAAGGGGAWPGPPSDAELAIDQHNPRFRKVPWGYDPEQVDGWLADWRAAQSDQEEATGVQTPSDR